MSTEISIKQLPVVTEINNDDLLLVQTSNATNTLKFENFVVGLENTTFAPTISSNATKVNYLSSVFDSTFFNAPVEDGPNILTNNTTSNTLSVIDTDMIPIQITSGGQKKTYYFLLSAGQQV
tara:strand:- start:475 stop:840 length:366 start_codon:yes stop_codon:yes gene_type:complete